MNTLANRIKAARKAAKLTQDELAKRTGLKQGTIAGLESGKSSRTTSTAELASALGVSIEWLATGKGEMNPLQYPHYRVEEASDDPSLQIPYMNARGSCGGGSLNEQTWIKGYMSKEASWFAKFKVKNTDLVAIYADGDSMADFIVDGDMVIFDTSKTIPIDGHIFAIEHPSGTNKIGDFMRAAKSLILMPFSSSLVNNVAILCSPTTALPVTPQNKPPRLVRVFCA